MQNIVLENKSLRLEFSRANGALVGLTAIEGRRSSSARPGDAGWAGEGGWRILDRPHLGLSYRLLVPLRGDADWHEPGQRNNPVLGEKQPVSAAILGPDGRSVTFRWDSVTSEIGGPLPIALTLQVSLTDRQAVFALTVENRSQYVVENVYCPYLGDLQHPDGEAWFKTFLYQYATAQEWSLWPTYQNMRGYFGNDYPIQFSQSGHGSGAPMSPFILLRTEKQGLYAGICAPSSELVAWHTELRPGYGNSIDGRVPVERTIGGHDVATRFAAVHVPYVQPGETRALTPIALEAYLGDWQQGVDIYKAWRSTWMTPARPPEWAREPHAWQQLHINSPEDELRIAFRDLPKIGAECARHGVKAIQLVGWNDGGQDQGNPSHDPDPRLGTFEELREAIRQVQALGVKIILFAKFTWADRGTERFREDLVRQAIKDPYGDFYHYQGYQYQTATQFLDINTKRLIPMCFLSEEYLRICDEEFAKMVALGADGILFDECLHHSPALLCFDTSHGHRPGAPVYANDRRLIWNFGRISGPANPDFLFAGEACYDWEMEAYQVSYHRSESKGHIPLSRYMLPEAQFMTAVTGFDDRNMVNQCLLNRYIISYEPFNFKGHLDDYPATVAYGKQMDALRTELREYLWEGEFRDKVGASVTTDGKPHHPYAVFLSRASGKVAVAVANYEEDAVAVRIALADGTNLARYRLVDDATWHPASRRSSSEGGNIVVPPYSAAVVVP